MNVNDVLPRSFIGYSCQGTNDQPFASLTVKPDSFTRFAGKHSKSKSPEAKELQVQQQRNEKLQQKLAQLVEEAVEDQYNNAWTKLAKALKSETYQSVDLMDLDWFTGYHIWYGDHGLLKADRSYDLKGQEAAFKALLDRPDFDADFEDSFNVPLLLHVYQDCPHEWYQAMLQHPNTSIQALKKALPYFKSLNPDEIDAEIQSGKHREK